MSVVLNHESDEIFEQSTAINQTDPLPYLQTEERKQGGLDSK